MCVHDGNRFFVLRLPGSVGSCASREEYDCFEKGLVRKGHLGRMENSFCPRKKCVEKTSTIQATKSYEFCHNVMTSRQNSDDILTFISPTSHEMMVMPFDHLRQRHVVMNEFVEINDSK